mgnify:CR=1 FL=1
MRSLFGPAIALMNRLRFRAKFTVVLVVVMIPAVALSYLVVSNIRKTNGLIAQERRGIEEIAPLRQLVEHIAQHRGMTNAYLKGDASFKDKILAKRHVIDQDFTALLDVDAQVGTRLNLGDRAHALQQQWKGLKGEAFSLPAAQSFQRHTRLIAQVMNTITAAAEASSLVLDPVLVSHNLVGALTDGLPTLAEYTGQARGFGSGVIAQGRLNNEARLRLSLLKDKIAVAHRTLDAEMKRVFAEAPSLAGRLQDQSDRAVQATRRFLDLTDREILGAAHIDLTASSYFDAGTQAIAADLALFDGALPVLDELLAKRSAAGSRTEWASYWLIAGVLLVVIYLLTALYLAIEDNLERMRQSAQLLADGDLTARLTLPTRDETAQIGTSFNAIAEGLSESLYAVRSANDHLSTVAAQMLESSQHTAKGVEKQMTEIDQAAAAIHEMAAAVQEVARNTSEAADAAAHADDASGAGRKIVEESIESINVLAEEVRRAADAIERLEKETDAVSGVLNVIRGIADQTNLLALNAAIEAARAGERGRGFAVVADEVRTLAQRTQQSTVEIQSMIEGLQSGAGQAVQVMRRGGEQADSSVEQATGAGIALRKIAEAVATINNMNAQIATSSQEQSSVSEEINRNITNVTEVAEQTALDAQQSTAASAQVAALASEMNLMLKRFRLDEAAIDETRRKERHDVLFAWDESFSVGVEEVDRQHRRLVDLINELHREMSKRRGVGILSRILEGLIEYTETHFAFEEKLMREHGYPDYQAHKAGHEKLHGQVQAFQRRLESGDTHMLSELLTFLSEWLSGHIKGADRAFGPFLNEKGVR